MEGVPRIPMLAFELKSGSDYVDFTSALQTYITKHYHENAESYLKECLEMDHLRQSAVQVTIDFMGCSLLKKYFSQLLLLQSRFPMGAGEAIELSFKWDDPYSHQVVAVTDVKYEQACILYNIGALHSILGGMDNRTTPEGMKISCTHFQCASWAFQHLDDVYGSFGCAHMSHELLTFQSTLMLAQAQECILEKSMTDSRKSSITAKVAAQIVDYYKLAMRNLDASNPSNVIGSKKYKEWHKRLEVKMNFYHSIMYLYLGTQSEEQQKWGERLTYFQAALERLNEAIRLNKAEDSSIEESLRFTLDVIGGKYNAAKKDNDFVYHDKVPALETLPEVKGAPLVKGIPFNPSDPEVSGPDIFKKLVPMEAHKASSLYSEEKAKLLRKVGANIEEKDKEVDQFMASLQLDPSSIFPEPQRLPQALLEKCAAISVKPEAIKDLIDAMQSLSGISTDVEGNLKEISDLLEDEERMEKQMKEVYGTKRTSNVIIEEIRKDCQKCTEGLNKAATSNNELNKLMRLHISNLRLLSGPLDELQKALPSYNSNYAPEDEATMQEMKRLMDKVDEMRKQRRHLEQQLREQVLKDDITSVLVTKETKNQDEIFEQQLSKHNKMVGLLDQNMTAQANILTALTETNAKYAKIRRDLLEVNARRDAMVRAIIQSYEVYEDLLAKTQKGVEFYGKLDSNVSRLLERTRSVYKIEQEEREKILERLAPKGPPPARPTAPKPGQFPITLQGVLPDAPMSLPGQFIAPSAGIGPMPFVGDSMSDGPKLKDFLPFMKPASFGSKSATGGSAGGRMSSLSAGGMPPIGQLPPGTDMRSTLVPSNQQPGSLPSSHSASPVHLPQPSASHPSSPLTVTGHPHIPHSLNSVSASVERMNTGPGPNSDIPGSSASFPSGFSTGQMPDSVPGTMGFTTNGTRNADSVLSPTAPPGAPGSNNRLPGITTAAGTSIAAAHPGGPVEQPTRPPPSQTNHQLPGSGAQQQSALPFAYAGGSGGNSGPAFPPDTVVSYPGASSQYGPPFSQSYHSRLQQPSGSHQVVATNNYSSAVNPGMVSSYLGVAGSVGAVTSQGSLQDYANGTFGHGPVQFPAGGPAPSPQRDQNAVGQGQGPQSAGFGGQGQQGWDSKVQVSAGQGPTGQSLTAQGGVGHLPGSGAVGQALPGQGHIGQALSGRGYVGHVIPGQGVSGPGVVGQGLPTQSTVGQSPAGQFPADRGVAPDGMLRPFPGQPLPPCLPQSVPGVAGQSQPYQPGQSYLSSGQQYQSSGQQVVSASSFAQVPAQHQLPRGNVIFSAMPQSAGAPPFQVTASGSPLHSVGGQPVQYPAGVDGNTRPAENRLPSVSQPYTIPGGPYPPPPLAGTGAPQLPPPAGVNYYQQPQPFVSGVYQPPQTNVAVPAGGQRFYQQQPSAGPSSYQQPQPAVSGTYYHPQPATTGSYQQPQPAGVSLASSQAQLVRPGSYHQASAVSTSSYGAQIYPSGTNAYQQVSGTSQVPGHPGTSQQMLGHPGTSQQVPGQTGTSQQMPIHPGTSQQMPVYPGTSQQIPMYPGTSQQMPMHPGTSQQMPMHPGTSQQMPLHSGTSQHPGASQQMMHHPGVHQQVPVPTGPGQQMPIYQRTSQPMPADQQAPATSAQPYPTMQQNSLPVGAQPPLASPYGQSQGYGAAYGASGITSGPPKEQRAFYPPNSFQSPTMEMPSSLPSPLQPSRPLSVPCDQTAAFKPQPPGAAPIEVSPAGASDGAVPADGAGSSYSAHPPVERRNSVSSNASSSLDELLSASPKNQPLSTGTENVLIPKVITAEDRRREKEEEARKNLKQSTRDPYTDPDLLGRFVTEVEKFQKHVDGLCKETLGKYTPLEKEWKELNDEQERTAKQFSMAIARCYPLKNRYPDVMPFDSTRVKLTGANDDYVNASLLASTAVSCPEFIATQSPLPATFVDFWQMVHDQGTEVIVMLCAEQEPGTKNQPYWPLEKGQIIVHGSFQLTLQSVRTKPDWVERIITMSHKTTRQSRSVVHLQFLFWPPAGVPESPAALLHFLMEVHNFYIQQRSLMRPVVVHCSNGIGRTGAFCVIYTGIQEINQGHGIISVLELVTGLRRQRKFMVQHKEQLKFCYDAILYYAQDVLMKRGILTTKASFGDKLPQPGDKSHVRNPSEDFVFGHSNIMSLQHSLAKLSTHQNTPNIQADPIAKTSTLPSGGDLTLPAGEPLTEALLPMEKEGDRADDRDVQSVNGKGVVVGENVASQSSLSRPNSAPVASDLPDPHSATNSRSSTPSLVQLPLSLADLQNPNTFKMDVTQPTKKKITKASFLNPNRSLTDGSTDLSDPLSQLDPLWSLKDKTGNS